MEMDRKSIYKGIINNKIDKQIGKGLAKYNTMLEGNQSLTLPKRIDHLSEELIDALFYIEHLKVANSKNDKYKEIVIDAVGSLIYLVTKVEDTELKDEMIESIKAINNAVKDMI